MRLAGWHVVAGCCWGLLGAGASPALALTPADLYSTLAPSVWRVVTYDADGVPLGQGSAIVVGVDTLTTNCHVLAKAKRVSVQREKIKLDARLELWDTERDLCQVKAAGLQAPAVPLVSSDQLRVGQAVYAIGNPQGLESTLSSGLVSSLRRDDAGRVILIQTSAPISRGSSGGGLFDDQGRLVGVTTMGSVTGDAQNLNFAVPADWVAELPARHAKLNKATTPTGPAAMPASGSASAPSVALAPPASEGSQEGPSQPWRRGDEFEYRVTDRFTGKTRQAVYRVDRVDGDRVVFNDGARTEGLDGRLIDFASAIGGDMDTISPPGGWVEEDAVTRMRWTSRFDRHDAAMRTSFDLQGWFEGDVMVDTPAGAYQAVVVVYDGWARRSVSNVPGSVPLRVKVRVWYSAALRRVVRFESEVRPSDAFYSHHASREIVELVRARRGR